MTSRALLKLIEDELDSIQVRVRLQETPQGVQIVAGRLSDRLLAKREVERRGFTVRKELSCQEPATTS